MSEHEETYFLYSGRLFRDVGLVRFDGAYDDAPPTIREGAGERNEQKQPRPEEPSPEGPEGEPVGEDDERAEERGDAADDDKPKPSPGPGAAMFPEPGAPDANPIDPRVF